MPSLSDLKKAVCVILVGFVVWSVVTSPARASSDQRKLGVFGDWAAFTFTDNGNKVCYMSSQPKKDEGKYSKRGEIFTFITHWPADKAKNVVSVSAGYSYMAGSEIALTVDGKAFKLFTKGEMAWAKDQDTDNAIASAIAAGSKMVIKGTSQRGTVTTDTYSLKGAGEALAAINAECGGQ